MAASHVSRPKHLGVRFAPGASTLAALIFIGTISATSAQGESVALTSAVHERGVALATDELAGLSLPALGASPVTAAAIHSAASVGIFPSDAPIQSHRATRSLDPASTPPNEAEIAKLAVPEPTTLILGLTSTLVLGSLSWKRRLTQHHHPSRV